MYPQRKEAQQTPSEEDVTNQESNNEDYCNDDYKIKLPGITSEFSMKNKSTTLHFANYAMASRMSLHDTTVKF
jgi:hypothetical protein